MIDGETYNGHLKMLVAIQIEVPAMVIIVSFNGNLKHTSREKIAELIMIFLHQIITSILKDTMRVRSEFGKCSVPDLPFSELYASCRVMNY